MQYYYLTLRYQWKTRNKLALFKTGYVNQFKNEIIPDHNDVVESKDDFTFHDGHGNCFPFSYPKISIPHNKSPF